MIMSIIGPRKPHDYRNYNLLVRGINSLKKTKTPPPKKKKTSVGPEVGASYAQVGPVCLPHSAVLVELI